MSAGQAGAICTALARAGVSCWVMGGWGVDALLGRVTREHHDLDLLVDVASLPALASWMADAGFAHRYDWDETAPVELDGATWSTAYVAGHVDGRELDVHAVVPLQDGACRLATTDPWVLPEDTLTGTGRIGEVEVRCTSVAAQRAMHRGYDLPEHHVRDLAALDRS